MIMIPSKVRREAGDTSKTKTWGAAAVAQQDGRQRTTSASEEETTERRESVLSRYQIPKQSKATRENRFPEIVKNAFSV